MSGEVSYSVPHGPLRLAGPVVRPDPGTLPLRGDLAHMALAGQHLAAHYVIPHLYTVNASGAALALQAASDSETICAVDQGSTLEVLDFSGDWAWATVGPDGPSGYIPSAHLTQIAG